MTTLLTGISVGLGALVVLLLALLVVRWRSDRKTDERVAEVVESLNARMDELGQELQGALERAEEEGRRSRIFGELAGSIDLDEVLSRTLEAAGGLPGVDAALVLLPQSDGGKPVVATPGLSVEEARRASSPTWTRSPGSTTGGFSTRRSRARSLGRTGTRASWGSSCSTSTTSRRSTTGSDTWPATPSSRRRPSGSARSCVRPTSPA